MADEAPYRVGAVVYHPKVEQIWAAFGEWFAEQGLALEVRYASSYDDQVAALLAGELDTAWNTNLAHVQVLGREPEARALAMRDTDRGWRSHLVARATRPPRRWPTCRARASASATPTRRRRTSCPSTLRREGIDPARYFAATRLDRDLGKHGDTGGAELAQLARVRAGELDASVVSSVTLEAIGRLGDDRDLRTVWTSPPFHHCCFTTLPGGPHAAHGRFAELLFAMDAADPKLCEPMQLEYVNRWVDFDPRGYEDLIAAVKAGPVVIG